MAEAVGDKRPGLSLHWSDRPGEKSPERRARSRSALPMPAGRPLGMLERQGHTACQVSFSAAASSFSRQSMGRERQSLVQRRQLPELLAKCAVPAACSRKRLTLSQHLFERAPVRLSTEKIEHECASDKRNQIFSGALPKRKAARNRPLALIHQASRTQGFLRVSPKSSVQRGLGNGGNRIRTPRGFGSRGAVIRT